MSETKYTSYRFVWLSRMQQNLVQTRDVPIPHFKLIPILLLIPPFRADTDTANTTDSFLSIKHHQ